LTCCAVDDPPVGPGAARRFATALLLAASAAACASGGSPSRGTAPELLTNPSLSPAYSQWLVGPVAEMATSEEIEAYLALDGDERAATFVEAFWARRNPYPQRPDNVLLELFEKRAADADRLFSEAGYLGRRTARGTVYVLYGEPAEEDYQVAQHSADPPITVWEYPANAPAGLDGDQPQRFYRFVKRKDVTEFYTPRQGPDLERPGRRPPRTMPF
jgi:GWxTD domain-containing protein